MKKIIFLDRDGVINHERGDYTYKIEDFVFLSGLFETLSELVNHGYEFVVITNQGGIAKGRYSLDEFRALNDWMINRFKEEGITILKTYFSPDHDDYSKSLSRKPQSILFERAIHHFDVDVSESWMIGDSQRDIDAAEKVDVKGILVKANAPVVEWKNRILNG